jgi:hypothetical protein
MVKALEIIRALPEECAVGEMVAAESVPHWDGRIRLTQFFPSALGPDEQPWIFAASYDGLDPVGWRRVE